MGSIVTPPNRTARAKHFCGNLQPIQLQITWRDTRIFLADQVLLSGQGCPTLDANCLADSAACGGSPRLQGLLGFVIVQSRKHKQLWARRLRSSYRIMISQIQHNFCAVHTNLGFVNFFLGATARARSMTAKVLKFKKLDIKSSNDKDSTLVATMSRPSYRQ